MIPTFTPVDAVLWSLAVALAAAALWLSAPRAARWDVARFFAAAWAAGRAPAPVPFEEAPPPEGAPSGSTPGDEQDPVRRLGVGCDWAAVGRWAPEVEAAVTRKLAGTRVVWFEPPVVDLGPVEQLPPPAAAHDRLEALLAPAAARLVLVASTEAQALLELLHELPGLRDRVRAVLLVGATPDPAWVAREFRHESFHLELARATPYCTLRTAPGQALRTPATPPTGRVAVDVQDLGRIPPDALADPALGRALRVTLAALA